MDDHASNGAVEAMGHSHEALTTTSKIVLEKVLGVSIMPTNLSDLAVAGETFRVTSEIDLLCERVAEHLSKKKTMSNFQSPLLNFGDAVLAKESGAREGKLGSV